MNHLKQFEKYSHTESKFIYHGTNKRFRSFDMKKAGKGYGMSYWGHGIYFADEKRNAIKYAKWVVEKNGGAPYVYSIDINGFNFYEFDYADTINLGKDEQEKILTCLRKEGDPAIIKQVRMFHPDYNWKDETDKRFKDYIYDGTNGEEIIDAWIERFKVNLNKKEYAYSSKCFYEEILPEYFNNVEKGEGQKLTSEFLVRCGYDGVVYVDDVDSRNYVIFNVDKISGLKVEKIN